LDYIENVGSNTVESQGCCNQ